MGRPKKQVPDNTEKSQPEKTTEKPKNQWEKGMQSPNPGGKPAGLVSLKTQIQQGFLGMMKTEVDHKGKKKIFFDAFNETFLEQALDPTTQTYKFIADRLFDADIVNDIEASITRSVSRDTDFQLFRIYKKGFDMQQKALLSASKNIGIMAGRRAGKSETNKLKSVMASQEKKNARIIIIGLTVMKTMSIYWDDIINIIKDLGLGYKALSTEQRIEFDNGSFIQFAGNSNRTERERFRGQHYDLIIVDEAQSQPELGMFVREIITPMLMDTNGVLMMTGSGPRTRGTYWESYYMNPRPADLRMNWNLASNPHIHDYQNALEEIKKKENLSENDSIFLREYMGQIVYDDDALVFRMWDANYYNDDILIDWLQKQSPEDIRFVGGLDYGFRDSDAFAVVMYSEKSNEKFLVYEYKQNETDVSTLCEAIKAAKEYIDIKFKPYAYHRDVPIYADTSDQKISMELSSRYGIPVFPAIKYDKTMAIQMLRDEVRKGNLRVVKGSGFDEEALRIIYKRFEQEGQPSVITKEIDDDVYHPDLMDAILYAMRNYWLTHEPDHKAKPVIYNQQEEYTETIENHLKSSQSQLF